MKRQDTFLAMMLFAAGILISFALAQDVPSQAAADPSEKTPTVAEDAPSQTAVDPSVKIPTVDDPDSFLRAQMQARWSAPLRKKWRIDYRPIDGMKNTSVWHIEGTMWWVRLHPTAYSLDKLDKSAVYEIDATALDQNYGVIDFYAYHCKKVTQ